jgi:hypothetical protein
MIVGWSTIDNLVYWRQTIEFCTTLCNLCSHYVISSVPHSRKICFTYHTLRIFLLDMFSHSRPSLELISPCMIGGLNILLIVASSYIQYINEDKADT